MHPLAGMRAKMDGQKTLQGRKRESPSTSSWTSRYSGVASVSRSAESRVERDVALHADAARGGHSDEPPPPAETSR